MTERQLELVLVTGMSGAGRSTAAHALEDLEWFVIDNLPPALLSSALEQVAESATISKLAVVIDVRGGSMFADVVKVVHQLRTQGQPVQVVFLDAADEVLIRRFESNRRPHPLQGHGRILDGIEKERRLLGDVRANADLVMDTSVTNVHELRRKITAAFAEDGLPRLHATVLSFGFKYGIPTDADLVADMRFLANPHWVPELRPKTGRDSEVRDYVLGLPGAQKFLGEYAELVHLVTDGYLREGKRYVTIAVGCTGGKHRSVAMSEALAEKLRATDIDTVVIHRDLGRE